MIGHQTGLELGIFVLVAAATLAVLMLWLRRRSRRRTVPLRSASTLAATESAQLKQQVAAVPVRLSARGDLEVLVISTRGSGRWTVPKGWPMPGRSDPEAAAREAYEEAGVRGTIVAEPIGTFEYAKRRNERESLLVTVYRLDVTMQVRRWRERGQRRTRWLPATAAADCVAWAGLAEIIRSLETTRAESALVLRDYGDQP